MGCKANEPWPTPFLAEPWRKQTWQLEKNREKKRAKERERERERGREGGIERERERQRARKEKAAGAEL